MLVQRHRVEPAGCDAEIHLQLFQQRDVHLRLVVAQADDVARGGGSPHHLDGDQNERRVARLGAARAFIPAQQSQRKVECVCAALLKGYFRGAVQFLDVLLQLRLAQR